MKIRSTFVSNSSSTSFIITVQNVSTEPKLVLDILKDNIEMFNNSMDCGCISGSKNDLIDYWIGAFRTSLSDESCKELGPGKAIVYIIDTLGYGDDTDQAKPEFTLPYGDTEIQPTELIVKEYT